MLSALGKGNSEITDGLESNGLVLVFEKYAINICGYVGYYCFCWIVAV